MKMDFFLFLLSFTFSLVWLLIDNVVSTSLMWVSFIRYVPILFLYIKYFRNSFSAYLPLLFILFLTILYVIGDSNYSISGLLVVAMFPIHLYVFCILTFSRKEISLLVLFLLLAYLAFFVICRVSDSYINPNQVAFTYLILLVNLFFCLFTNTTSKSVFNSFLIVLLVLCTLFLILNTESRNPLLVLLLFGFSFFFRRRVKHLLPVLILVLVLYILYPLVYCQFANDVDFRAAQNTEMFNQDFFSGREIIWSYVFEQLKDPSAFYFGGIDTEWWGKSIHNSALDIVSRYGIPSLIFLDIIIVYYFRRMVLLLDGNSVYNKYKSLLLLIIVTMLWGINESGLFLGTSFFVFLPYCIVHSKTQILNHFE